MDTGCEYKAHETPPSSSSHPHSLTPPANFRVRSMGDAAVQSQCPPMAVSPSAFEYSAFSSIQSSFTPHSMLLLLRIVTFFVSAAFQLLARIHGLLSSSHVALDLPFDFEVVPESITMGMEDVGHDQSCQLWSWRPRRPQSSIHRIQLIDQSM